MKKVTRKSLILEAASLIRKNVGYITPRTARAEQEYSFTELKRVLVLIDTRAMDIINAINRPN